MKPAPYRGIRPRLSDLVERSFDRDKKEEEESRENNFLNILSSCNLFSFYRVLWVFRKFSNFLLFSR